VRRVVRGVVVDGEVMIVDVVRGDAGGVVGMLVEFGVVVAVVVADVREDGDGSFVVLP
jgi:hypothetical protein